MMLAQKNEEWMNLIMQLLKNERKPFVDPQDQNSPDTRSDRQIPASV
jgi:hypothetical protein